MIDPPKIGIPKPSVDRGLVLEYEYMLTGRGSMLSRSQCLRPGSVELPGAPLLPDGRVRKIRLTSGLEGLCVMAASSSTLLPTRTGTGGIAVVKPTSSYVDSPGWGVGDREPPSNDDRADVIISRAQGVSINNLKSSCWRIGLKLLEMLMDVLPFCESILQGVSNCVCSRKTRGLVDKYSVEHMVWPVYIPSMGSVEVGLNQREELEHRHIEVMFISVLFFPQEPLVDRIRIKRSLAAEGPDCSSCRSSTETSLQ